MSKLKELQRLIEQEKKTKRDLGYWWVYNFKLGTDGRHRKVIKELKEIGEQAMQLCQEGHAEIYENLVLKQFC